MVLLETVDECDHVDFIEQKEEECIESFLSLSRSFFLFYRKNALSYALPCLRRSNPLLIPVAKFMPSYHQVSLPLLGSTECLTGTPGRSSVLTTLV